MRFHSSVCLHRQGTDTGSLEKISNNIWGGVEGGMTVGFWFWFWFVFVLLILVKKQKNMLV